MKLNLALKCHWVYLNYEVNCLDFGELNLDLDGYCFKV